MGISSVGALDMMKILLGTVAALALASSAQSAVIISSNFDSIPVAPGTFVIIPFAEGWTATAGDGIEVQNHAAGDPLSETNLVELDSNNNSAMSLFNLAPGDYVLDFFYSARPNIPASSNGIDVLLNGSSIFNITGDGGSGTNWLAQHVEFSLLAPTTLTFAAVGTSDSLGGYLDNITLSTAAVPEPGTWGLMLLGFAGIGMAARRSRKPVLAQLA
jgi:hypothetical protein